MSKFKVGDEVQFTYDAAIFYGETNPEWLEFWGVDDSEVFFGEFTVKRIVGQHVWLNDVMQVHESELQHPAS